MECPIRNFSPPHAIGVKNQVVDIYRSVYSLPPYNETDSQIEKFSESWETRTSKNGFVFVGAVDKESDRLVGFSYGWRSTPGDEWNRRLSEQLGNLSNQWLSNCFEFVDLAVDPSAQGFGLGRDLTRKLFALVDTKTAILLTHQTTTKASEMYMRNGWTKVVEHFEVAPGKLFQIMGKTL